MTINDPSQQPVQPPGPQQYQTVYAIRPPYLGLAIASLVLSGVAFLLGWIAGLGLVLAIAGVVCGHMALSKIKNTEGPWSGRGLAIAGLIVGYVGIAWGAIYLAWTISFTAALNDAFNS